MAEPFVPPEFDVPLAFEGPGFRLAPLNAVHNARDHEAWMTSIDHIRNTPGMKGRPWPTPMSLKANLEDLEMHAQEFVDRTSFTYSVLDGEEVIGCLYIYPGHGGREALIRSWVRTSRSEMDVIVWRAVKDWLIEVWPFSDYDYADRRDTRDPAD